MPPKILLGIHAPPYGSEHCLSALRAACALAGKEGADAPELRVFLIVDAPALALPNQRAGGGTGRLKFVDELAARHRALVVCRTCALARGLAERPLVPGVRIGTRAGLADSPRWADKVLTF